MNIFEHSILGKKSLTPDKYDASLLFRIPRCENRDRYDIDASNLPFVGFDVWNCYEVSFLTANGLPVSLMMKLIYSCESEFIIESKSLKLYLNSFNMERFELHRSDAQDTVRNRIKKDIEKLLEIPVDIVFFDKYATTQLPFNRLIEKQIDELVSRTDIEQMQFIDFLENPSLLKSVDTQEIHQYAFGSNLLRSNCRVTNQPDWGDLFVRMETTHLIDFKSIIAYLISFRKENHFHEEVVEMIFKRFLDAFKPQNLMIAAMFTRRGGIDINPIRSSRLDWIDEAFISTTSRLEKTLRQ